MAMGLRLVILTLLVTTSGLSDRVDAWQTRPGPSGGQVPTPAPAPQPEPEPAPQPEPPPPDGVDPPEEPAPEPPPSAEFVEIRGHERLAWTQAAPSDEGLAALRFTVYVDAEARELAGVSCASAPAADGYECSSPVPAMSLGEHTLEVSAYTLNDGVRLEGFLSAPIFVRVVGANGSASSAGAPAGAVVSRTDARPAGSMLEATQVAAGLIDPTDIVTLPDGRILIAERAGRVRVVRDGTLLSAPAVSIGDAMTGDGHGLLSMAADREFAETGHVYALFSTRSGLALARFTVAGDALVDRAVLLDGLPVSAAHPSASIRTGPDGKLYISLDSRGNADSAGDLGSYSSKVLRLNTDGTTPEDQPGYSPVFRAGLDYPAGLAWSHDRSRMWMVGRDGLARERLDAVSADSATSLPPVSRFTLPAGTGPSAVVFYDHDASPELLGSLLVGAAEASGILRIWFDETGSVSGTEWLLQDELGPVRALAVAPDGSILVVSGDALLRISAR